jgi:hypothetical protein
VRSRVAFCGAGHLDTVLLLGQLGPSAACVLGHVAPADDARLAGRH